MGPVGLEPDSVSNNKTNHLRNTSDDCAAESGANGDEKPLHDSDLTLIIERWEQLPDAVKAGIVAMVEAASQSKGNSKCSLGDSE